MIDAINRAARIPEYYGLKHASIAPLGTGLINSTWKVSHKGNDYVLQWVNPMFPAIIHEDIAAVTGHLHDKGMITPRLVPTTSGDLYLQDNGQLWRLFNYLHGVSFNVVDTVRLASEAGIMLGRFHKALLDMDYQFKNTRTNVHDTRRHLQNLRTALKTGKDHRQYARIVPLAAEILDYAGQLPPISPVETRKVHGDPKINNFLFAEDTTAGVCMIDFDTLGHMMLPLELGDAMRSWGNPGGENTEDTVFSLENFRAALEGYASESLGFILEQEWQSILAATQTIYLELAARFCADALNEVFFSWDETLFAGRSEHNQVRATGQLNAYKSLMAQTDEASRILERVFS